MCSSDLARPEAPSQPRGVEVGELLCRVGRPVTYWFGVIDGLLKTSNDTAMGIALVSGVALMYFILVRRRPREVFLGSSLFIGTDVEDAKKHVIEQVFGSGLPCTPDEILERYNVDVVELTDELEAELNELANPSCPS